MSRGQAFSAAADALREAERAAIVEVAELRRERDAARRELLEYLALEIESTICGADVHGEQTRERLAALAADRGWQYLLKLELGHNQVRR